MTSGERVGNVYLIDTKMFGFSRYNSAFLVAGKEIALIDTGPATSTEVVRAGIQAHGFAIEDISYVFITHAHSDHCGNAGILLREMPKANVMIHPRGLEVLIDPSIDIARMKRDAGQKMAARFGEPVPVPSSRIQTLSDGEVFDLGNGEKLRVIFAPGHQPDAIAILDDKDMGLFAGDTPGLYYAEEDVLLMPSPSRSDMKQSVETLRMLMDIPATKLFLGHYGVCNRPKDVMRRALDAAKRRFDVGSETMEEGRPEELTSRIIVSIAPEIEKLRATRGGSLYEYMTEELVPAWSRAFAVYYQELQRKQ